MVLFGLGERCNSEFLKDYFKDSRDGSVLVNNTLQTLANDDVYAAGDLASFPVENLGYKRVAHYSEAIT